jgi:hypothetical protein
VPVGWPTDEDLAAKLGPYVTVDALVTSANEAAQAAAITHGADSGSVDPTAGAVNAEVFEAILALGQAWYQSRNLDPAYAQTGEFAVNVVPRQRALDIIRQGKTVIG